MIGRALLLACFVCATPLSAQVADTTRPPVVRVGEISVQAARPVTTAGGASALEVQLDSLGLAPAPTLEQVLRQLPLVCSADAAISRRASVMISVVRRSRATRTHRIGRSTRAKKATIVYCVNPNASGQLRLDASRRVDVDVSRDLRVRTGGFGSRLEVRAAVENLSDAAI